jgi:hypothetical protein
VIVEPARSDFPALLAQASISVSQAGYNTVLDVVRSGARPVLVPYAEHGETEQRMRASRLRELDLAVVVDGPEISAASLAGAIDAAGSKNDWKRWNFDCDGAARSAAIIVEMLERGAAQWGPGMSAAAPPGRSLLLAAQRPIGQRPRVAHRGLATVDAELDRWRSAGGKRRSGGATTTRSRFAAPAARSQSPRRDAAGRSRRGPRVARIEPRRRARSIAIRDRRPAWLRASRPYAAG